MSVLVTGGCGYIGSNTVVELIEAGYDVIILDNLSNSNQGVKADIEQITGKELTVYYVDLIDKHEIERIFEENSITDVIHLAGLKAISESIQFPLEYYNNNVLGTLNLLTTMEQHNIHNFIFSSSATVYGIPEELPIRETSSREALNPYGRTKLMTEQILEDLSASNEKWNIVSLRYFNPVGAHQSGLLAENPDGIPTNLVPYISKVATNELPELKVFGGDYETEDGTGVRDYIHVQDLAKGHVAALTNIEKLNGFVPLNLGTGKGYSVLEVINAFERASNVKIPHTIIDRREGDVAVCYSDSSLANNTLGWKASKNLNDMCNDTWQAIRESLKEKV